MLAQVQWAVANKAKFVELQRRSGIPALWAAAQHCHEAFNGDGTMSALLAKDNNGGGLKWAAWQAELGCTPVEYPTWEWVNGQNVKVVAKFCHAPSFDTWLQVYAHLLTLPRYQPALQYAADPTLYGAKVWAAGYATDPAYLAKRAEDGSIGGVVKWLLELWPHYADTLPGRPEPATPVTIQVEGAHGFIQGEVRGSATWAPLRPVVEGVGGKVEADWSNPAAPVVTLRKGCCCTC